MNTKWSLKRESGLEYNRTSVPAINRKGRRVGTSISRYISIKKFTRFEENVCNDVLTKNIYSRINNIL